jgi:hypothetical protein
VVQGEISVASNADIMSPQDAVTVSLVDIGAIGLARVNQAGWCCRIASADYFRHSRESGNPVVIAELPGLAPAGDLLSCSRKKVGKEALPPPRPSEG